MEGALLGAGVLTGWVLGFLAQYKPCLMFQKKNTRTLAKLIPSQTDKLSFILRLLVKPESSLVDITIAKIKYFSHLCLRTLHPLATVCKHKVCLTQKKTNNCDSLRGLDISEVQ